MFQSVGGISCKSYTGFSGIFQNLFGKAIKVVDDNNCKIYINKKELLNSLCKTIHVNINNKDLKQLSNIMVEVLHPVKGIDLTTKKINEVFEQISQDFSEHTYSSEELIQKFDQLKQRHLTNLTYQPELLLEHLKPGDILFKKNPDHSKSIVVLGQKVTTSFLRSKLVEREGYKYSHAAIYVGDGKIVEATRPDNGGMQIRIIQLKDSRFALNKDEGCSYTVSRCENPSLAQDAVNIALGIAKPVQLITEKQTNNNKHKYTVIQAARSIIHSVSFGLFAKQRYFKQFIDHRQGEQPKNFMSHKDFYCSNLVAYCYQAAESLKIVPKMIGVNNEPPKAYTSFGKALFRGAWARITRWKHIKNLDKKVEMKFDAKWMTPQDLRNFVINNPKIFNDQLYLRAI